MSGIRFEIPKIIRHEDESIIEFRERLKEHLVEKEETESLHEKIVRVALSQVGERERAGGPNKTKYHDWYDAHGEYKYLGQPWCAIFVCWVLDQAGARLPTIQGEEFGQYPGAAGVSILREWMKQQGWMLGEEEDPLPGDVVFFPRSHVGFVLRSDEDFHAITVEGNTTLGAEQSLTEWVWVRRRLSVGCAFARVPENYSSPG